MTCLSWLSERDGFAKGTGERKRWASENFVAFGLRLRETGDVAAELDAVLEHVEELL